mmetsp:Transcript_124361/g.247984  ORF Transcript_124361/g.247984 Transcript_124361/m.247984 type:complete len:218 (-) Transcript_124361:278-931(-)
MQVMVQSPACPKGHPLGHRHRDQPHEVLEQHCLGQGWHSRCRLHCHQLILHRAALATPAHGQTIMVVSIVCTVDTAVAVSMATIDATDPRVSSTSLVHCVRAIVGMVIVVLMAAKASCNATVGMAVVLPIAASVSCTVGTAIVVSITANASCTHTALGGPATVGMAVVVSMATAGTAAARVISIDAVTAHMHLVHASMAWPRATERGGAMVIAGPYA